MKWFVASIIVLALYPCSELLAQKSVPVRGYTRRDGTYVRPHMRSAPGSSGSATSSTSGGRIGSDSGEYTGVRFAPSRDEDKKHKEILNNSDVQILSGSSFRYRDRKFRLSGIDYYESRGCDTEKAIARLGSLLKAGKIEMLQITKDVSDYTIGRIWVDGKDVAEILVGEGLQRPKK